MDDEPSPIVGHKSQINVNEIDMTSYGIASIDKKSPVEHDIEWKVSQTMTNNISTEYDSIDDHQSLPQIPIDSQDSQTKLISLEKSSSHDFLSHTNDLSPVQTHMEIHISQAEMKSKDEHQSQIEMFKTGGTEIS